MTPLPNSPRAFWAFFQKAGNQIEELKTRYAKAETNVERIEGMLQDHQVQLLKDIAMLDKMYEMNMVYYKELTITLWPARKSWPTCGKTSCPAGGKGQGPGLPEDAQAAKRSGGSVHAL